jgi:hypothetical protein
MTTRPFNIRLPQWALDFISQRARDCGLTKTEVVLEALRRLKQEDQAALMRQGYAELRELDVRLAEEGLGKRLTAEVGDGT